MRALDDAVAAVLGGLGGNPGVYYGSAKRDTPPPYYVHRSTDSRPAAATGFGVEAREYEHSIVAVARDPDVAETMREAVVTALRGTTLPVADWGTSQRITWQGEVHDPGDLLPGGSIGYEAGDRFKITINRSTT
jgi:hypothetical protein